MHSSLVGQYMATKVTRDKLETNSYGSIHETLNNRSYIVDPRNPSNTSNAIRKLIYDYDPFHSALDFNLLPYIILALPTIEAINPSGDGKTKDIRWRHTITIRTARDGASNSNTDIGRTDMLNMADDLYGTFNSEAVKQSLRNLGLFSMQLTKIGVDTTVIDMKYVYECTYELQYSTRLQVSE